MDAASRIILTRNREGNGPWARRLTAAGRAVLDLPLVRFASRSLPAGFETTGYDWILFTSPQGVRAFAAAGLTAGSARCGCLGAGTTAALAGIGLADDLGADCRDGAELAAFFTAAVQAPGRVLLPGPARRMEDPRAALEAAGFTVTELPLYETLPVPPAELPEAPFAAGDVVFFCSPSAVRTFADAWSDRPVAVAIGETTAAALREAGFVPRVADRPNLEAMIRAAGLDPLPETVKPEMEP